MNYNIKLVAIDVDGTLVTDDKRITENTIMAIRKALDKGVFVSIASGRPLSGLDRFREYFKEDALFITYNGGKVIKIDTNEVIFDKCMGSNEAKDVLNYAFNNKIHLFIWKNDELYTDEYNEHVEYYEIHSGVKAHVVSDFRGLFENITKIILYDYHENLLKAKENLERINQNVNYQFSLPVFLEIFNKEVSKGNALEMIGKYYHINREEIMAIGDNFNDLSMIEYAKVGIAMGNAPDEIKQKAFYVTKTNEEDGVAYAINKFINNIGD